MADGLARSVDALPPDLDPRLARRAQAGAAWVLAQKSAGREVTVVHHIDADGLSAGAIAVAALRAAGVTYRTLAVKSLDDVHVRMIHENALGQSGKSKSQSVESALWFCDLGSTAYMHFPDTPRLVCDHHQLVRDGAEESFAHVNPLLDGLSGEEISGAGCAYLVAASLDAAHVALLPMALVGASADQQDRKEGRFIGANQALLRHGIAAGLVREATDIAFFGPETRPLRKFLALAEPRVPTVSGDQRSAERFLLECSIPLQDANGERTWSALTDDERRALRSRIVERLIDVGLAPRVERLFRQVVTIAAEQAGPTRELQEFGTLLNSTARYGRPEVGLAIAGGEREAFFAEAKSLLLDHRKHLASALDALARRGVQERSAVQWVHLEGDVLDTVVGIVAGMALEGLSLRRDLAIVAFAWTPDGRTKASTRSPHELQARGIDLAVACRDAAAALGGQGGGHKGAAGATIPRGAEMEFLRRVDEAVARQLGRAVVDLAGPRMATQMPATGTPALAATVAVAAEPTHVASVVKGRGAQTRFAA